MANLNAWQKIDRVVSGRPFGDGSGGNTTISSDPNTRATASGTAASSSLTIGSAILSNNDIFVIYQTRGTGVGQWEINMVASGGGTTSITTKVALKYTYTTCAQVIKFTMYDAVTVNAFTLPAWDGSTKGISVICGRTSITVSGDITATAKGFRGGEYGGANDAKQGESYLGLGIQSASPNGGGGGGSQNAASGGGGGYGGAGSNGTGTTPGQGGNTYGSADLTALHLGSGGGGAAFGGHGVTSGFIGGGAVILISKAITLSSAPKVNGQGTTGGEDTGGAGSGGSVLVVCQTASLGSAICTATGGTCTGASSNNGGNGGVGRIAVHHSGTVTGTTSPTFTDVTDAGLIETDAAFLFNLI